MAISRGNTQTATASGTTSLAVTKPTGLANGDVLLTVCGNSALTTTVPTGFTLVGRGETAATQEVVVAYKVVTDAGSEPASYTWTGLSGRQSVAISAYSGVDTSNVLDVAAVEVDDGGDGSLDLSTTTVTDGAMVYATAIGNWATSGMTVPAGLTEVFNLGNPGRRTAGADGVQATAGSTGTHTFTGGETLSMGGVIFALRPIVNVLGEGTASGSISFTGTATGVAPALATPTGLVATPVATDQIDLSWNAVTGASGYDIERDGNIIVLGHATTSYSDTGLSPATEYTYRVRAVV